MATETETPQDEYVKPNPQDNPRNISMKEIADKVAKQHVADAAETMPGIDDDGNVTPASEEKVEVEATPAEEAAPPVEEEAAPTEEAPITEAAPEAPSAPAGIDPAKEYEVEIDGQKMKVIGQKIIDAGFRTFQKETSADYRLKIATELLREAEQRAANLKTAPDAPAPDEPKQITDQELAEMIQFGSKEQAAEAIKILSGRGQAMDPQALQRFIVDSTRAATNDVILHREAVAYVEKEFKDLIDNPMLRRLFFLEENRRRAPTERGGEGDRRPYMELYKSIGEDMRKELKLSKPAAPDSGTPSTTTAKARTELKKATPTVPRTATSRLESAPAAKAKTPSEIIAAMAESRGKTHLTPRLRKE